MGRALLTGWLKAGIPASHISAQLGTSDSAAQIHERYTIRAAATTNYQSEDVVIIAVKPQILPSVLKTWRSAFPRTEPLFISLAAGTALAQLSQLLGANARIIRAMPNTPSLVGLGVTSLCAEDVSTDDRLLAEALFKTVGTVHWMKSEKELLSATALAGSGPAYVFYFAECLIEAATSLGMDEKTAREMVQQTLKGSVALADAEGWKLEELRQNVTSKGGVTEAALNVMQADEKLKQLLKEALQANIARAKALS